ncbi:MAG: chorismate synthase [Lachnospiraceae bacterium]|nr:chorismate synthase [Lachnospiraceae bacterium]
MKNTFGNNISVTLFGESHGPMIGVVLDGLAPGICVDERSIEKALYMRRPHGNVSTARREKDSFSIVSGVYNGKTTGTPLTILIPNEDTKSGDYELSGFRPGHADYTATVKYRGFEDPRGGGHFSGRITASLVAAGAVIRDALEKKGILTGTHIVRCAGVGDRHFSEDPDQLTDEIGALNEALFPVLDPGKEEVMKAAIEKAALEGDSVGGILETAVTGLPAGAGEPWFDTVEGVISHAVFSVPGIKGIEFGKGFGICDMKGSEANDPFTSDRGRIVTVSNYNGGINGGITNGMPVIFRCAVKPTPSIAKAQKTVDRETFEDTEIEIKGRHDPCIVHRARAVVDSVTAIAVADLLCGRFGTDWLGCGL